MKTLLILGAGTAGTVMANRLRKELDADVWDITLVDKDEDHLYQPGLLFVPFQVYDAERLLRPRRDFIPKGVDFVVAEVEKIEPDENRVHLTDGRQLDYDVLIVATGTTPRPEETPGLDGELWYRDAFDFYTYDGACALRDRLKTWEGGRLVIFLAESIFKCPIAPLEFAFLADAYFDERGIRDQVEITYVTPLSGAFTKPKAASFLGGLLDEKGITVVPDFYAERVDADRRVLVSYDELEVPFDLLVAVPVNMGADLVEASDMGDIDDLNYIPTDKQTLQSRDFENVFVIGDATNLPTSKAGSVAHFESEILTENVLSYIQGKPLSATFDGHANCFIETGHGKAALIDFNYDTEPLPGTFPLPVIGPMSLLKETRANHMGKLAFEWVYWHMLLTGKPLPVSTAMSMRGKKVYMRETEPA
ncbi:MAG: FAD/NAD(P)-binding oxidoreductase [Rubricoccaceae bacterium]